MIHTCIPPCLSNSHPLLRERTKKSRAFLAYKLSVLNIMAGSTPFQRAAEAGQPQHVLPEWIQMTDLASATFGGRVLFATDGEVHSWYVFNGM